MTEKRVGAVAARLLTAATCAIAVVILVAGCETAATSGDPNMIASAIAEKTQDARAVVACDATITDGWVMLGALDADVGKVSALSGDLHVTDDFESSLPADKGQYLAICVYEARGTAGGFDWIAMWVRDPADGGGSHVIALGTL